jgi:hypothetical protein
MGATLNDLRPQRVIVILYPARDILKSGWIDDYCIKMRTNTSDKRSDVLAVR